MDGTQALISGGASAVPIRLKVPKKALYHIRGEIFDYQAID